MRTRTGWLIIFCIGLLLAALVVEEFEDILKNHVELSIFVPLIMGHGGNTGSQTVATVVRALALKQVTHMDIFRVVMKEAGAGCLMGRCTAGGGHDMLGAATCRVPAFHVPAVTTAAASRHSPGILTNLQGLHNLLLVDDHPAIEMLP